MVKHEEKRKPDILRTLTTYAIPIIIVVAGLAVAKDRLARAEEDIDDKVDKVTHVETHVNVDLRFNHVEQAIIEVAQRVETVNFQAQRRHDKALDKILEKLE